MVHVLHIPKTGGSALFDALGPFAERSRLQLHTHATTLADVPDGDMAIFAVREPLSRFCSGFNSRLRRGRPLRDVPWTPGEASAFAQFSTPNALAEALDASDPDHRRAALDAVAAISHLRPLSVWLISAEEVVRRAETLFVLSQPDLTGDFAAMARFLDLPQARLPMDDLRSHRTPAGFSTHLSDKAQEALRQLYRQDADILAACMALRSERLQEHV